VSRVKDIYNLGNIPDLFYTHIQRMMRDFQGTIVEGAKEAIMEEAPGALASSGALGAPHVAQAYWDELRHLLRLCHYAAAAAVASFTDKQVCNLNPTPYTLHPVSLCYWWWWCLFY